MTKGRSPSLTALCLTALCLSALCLSAMAISALSPAAAQRTDPAGAKAAACPVDAPVGMGFYPRIARQGAKLAVSASEDHGPAGGIAVDLSRFSDWRISPEGAAELSGDRASLTVFADAPVGETLTLSAELCGERIEASSRIVGRDEKVLTGTWRQKEIACAGGAAPADPVRELRFSDRNRFAVTYFPFETYEDYWGDVAADLERGTIRMATTGGNLQPPGLDLEGGVLLDNRTLVLTDMFLGDRAKQVTGTCRYVFEAVGKLG